jgi:hypothetical protein
VKGKEKLTRVLHDLGHGFYIFGVVALKFLDLLVGRDEVHLVLLTYYFTCEFSLVILLADVPAFIIK